MAGSVVSRSVLAMCTTDLFYERRLATDGSTIRRQRLGRGAGEDPLEHYRAQAAAVELLGVCALALRHGSLDRDEARSAFGRCLRRWAGCLGQQWRLSMCARSGDCASDVRGRPYLSERVLLPIRLGRQPVIEALRLFADAWSGGAAVTGRASPPPGRDRLGSGNGGVGPQAPDEDLRLCAPPGVTVNVRR